MGPRTRSAPSIETMPVTRTDAVAPPGSVNRIVSPGTTPRFDARSRLTAIAPGSSEPEDSPNSPVAAE